MARRNPPAIVRPEVLGAMVQRAAGEVRALTLYVHVSEDEGEPVEFVLDVVLRDGSRAGATRRCLAEAIQAVLDRRPPGRQCRVCGEAKPLWAYAKSRTANTKDGRLPRCKACERVRVQKYKPTRSPMPAHQLN